MKATLRVVGERGFQNANVRLVLKHYGGNRAQFYKHFRSIADCYEQAYAAEAERLCEILLAAGREPDSWQAGMEVALCKLAGFVGEQPALARGLLIEVHTAGEPSLRVRREVFERLSRAIDSARRETKSRHSPPPLTAIFIVHMIDAAVVDSLLRESAEQFSPSDITELAATYYDLSSPRSESTAD